MSAKTAEHEYTKSSRLTKTGLCVSGSKHARWDGLVLQCRLFYFTMAGSRERPLFLQWLARGSGHSREVQAVDTKILSAASGASRVSGRRLCLLRSPSPVICMSRRARRSGTRRNPSLGNSRSQMVRRSGTCRDRLGFTRPCES